MILRFLIVIGFVLALVAAGGSFSIYSSYQTEREQRLDSESKLMQVQDSAAVIKADMEQQKSRMSDLEAQIQSLKLAEKDFKSQQSAKDSELVAVKNELASKQNELLSLQTQIENYRKKERAAIPASKTVSDTSASGANTNSSTVVSSENLISSSPPLPVIPAEAPVSSDSRILTVNRKFNFIVVNLGLRDGLRMGDKVQVVQGSTQKALAQIEKIYDKFSAATLLSEDKGNPVHEGDSVRKA